MKLYDIDSQFHNAHQNIALEYLLQNKPAHANACFLTYVNDQSIVIGRNQDADTELSEAARSSRLPWYRRTSGGGAVYHDEGNLNWSFVLDGSLEDRPRLLSAVVDALKPLGLDINADDRGALFCGRFKIGGTASSQTRGRLLFHGTLLVHSKLDQLHRCLAAHQPGYLQSHAASSGHSGAVRSRPSETANLSDLKPGLTTPDVISLLHSGISLNLAGRPLAGHPAAIGNNKSQPQPDLPTENAILEYSNIFLSAQWKESRRLPELPTAAALRNALVPARALNYTNRKGNL